MKRKEIGEKNNGKMSALAEFYRHLFSRFFFCVKCKIVLF